MPAKKYLAKLVFFNGQPYKDILKKNKGFLSTNSPFHQPLPSLLKGSSNSHHLTHTLHGRANARIHGGELLQIPTWHLRYHVIQGGFEAGRGATRHAIPSNQGRFG